MKKKALKKVCELVSAEEGGCFALEVKFDHD